MISFFYIIIIIYILLLATHTLRLWWTAERKRLKAAYICIFSPSNFVSLSSPSSCAPPYTIQGAASFPAVSCSVPHYGKNCFINFFFFLCVVAIDIANNPPRKKKMDRKQKREWIPSPLLYSRKTGLEKKLINAAEYIYNIVCVERKRKGRFRLRWFESRNIIRSFIYRLVAMLCADLLLLLFFVEFSNIY